MDNMAVWQSDELRDTVELDEAVMIVWAWERARSMGVANNTAHVGEAGLRPAIQIEDSG